MDDRTRRMIEAYIPSPPDTTLEDGEYYYRQETAKGPRIIRVFPLDILPHHDGTEYGIYQRKGAQLVRVDTSGYGDLSVACASGICTTIKRIVGTTPTTGLITGSI